MNKKKFEMVMEHIRFAEKHAEYCNYHIKELQLLMSDETPDQGNFLFPEKAPLVKTAPEGLNWNEAKGG